MGAWVSGGISGGHLNPAVSTSSHTLIDSGSLVIGYSGIGYLAWLPVEEGSWYVNLRSSPASLLNFIFMIMLAFIFAQVMGGLVGAAIVYRNYINAIDIFEGGRSIRTQATASLFATYAVSCHTFCCLKSFSFSSKQDYMNAGSCFFVEFLGTAILVFVVVAVTDKNNNAPPSGMLPLSLFLVLLGLGASLGMQTCEFGHHVVWYFANRK